MVSKFWSNSDNNRGALSLFLYFEALVKSSMLNGRWVNPLAAKELKDDCKKEQTTLSGPHATTFVFETGRSHSGVALTMRVHANL